MKHNPLTITPELRTLFPLLGRRRTKLFAYGFFVAFVAFTAYIAFFPSDAFLVSVDARTAPYRSHFSSFVCRLFPDSAFLGEGRKKGDAFDGFGSSQDGVFKGNTSDFGFGSQENGGFVDRQSNSSVGIGSNVGSPKDDVLVRNQSNSSVGSPKDDVFGKIKSNSSVASLHNDVVSKNQSNSSVGSQQSEVVSKDKSNSSVGSRQNQVFSKEKSISSVGSQIGNNPKETGVSSKNQTVSGNPPNKIPAKESPSTSDKPENRSGGSKVSNFTESASKGSSDTKNANNNGKQDWSVESMKKCDLFHGRWVKDKSYPLFPQGSCPHIDEAFNCILNGRPDKMYQKLRWQPSGCNIPRLNGTDMLERLRGKRLAFIGDSLNRNMWESLVCILRNSVKDKKKVYEASGRSQFRTESSYTFLFKDYDFRLEFFVSPFLVQPWEAPDANGKKRETLRLDVIEKSVHNYKDVDVLVFNTGHWWTHEKTSKGKGYYQEGYRVYDELDVNEAFRKALKTWAKWVDTNINPEKTLVLFRGYSPVHFSGGQWNSGGQCDSETDPIDKDEYLTPYPSKMTILESVISKMKTPVSYMNITKMSDYRKDGHPSIYRKHNSFDLQVQDCSHWCLPGVPDSWNELLYAELIMKQDQVK